MAYGCNPDSALIFEVEEQSVIAAANTEAAERRLKLLHIANPGHEVTSDAAKNLDSSFSIDGAKIRSRLRRPANRNPTGCGWLDHLSHTAVICAVQTRA